VNDLDVLVYVVEDRNPAKQGVAIRRAAAKCAKLSMALVLDCARASVDVAALAITLADLMGQSTRPPAVSVVVLPADLNALRRVSHDLALRGIVLGDFTSIPPAIVHARRERLLVLPA